MCSRSTILYLGSRSRERLASFLGYLGQIVNRVAGLVIKREVLDVERARTFAFDLAEELAAMPRTPWRMIIPLLLALANKTALILVLTLSFLAFGVPFTEGTIIGRFAIGYLFMIVSPTLAGVGVMEGMFILAPKLLACGMERSRCDCSYLSSSYFLGATECGGVDFANFELGKTRASR